MKAILILLFLFLLRKNEAGKRPSLAARIIDGGAVTELTRINYAHQVRIESFENGKREGVGCGGSLINNCWVLTAAHCLHSTKFNSTLNREITFRSDFSRIYIGTIDLREAKNGAGECRRSDRAQYYFFPEWDHKKLRKNDLALIKLTQAITADSEKIATISMPDKQSCDSMGKYKNNYVTISGWGHLRNGKAPNILQTAEVKVRSGNLCKHHYDGLDGESFSAVNKICVLGENSEKACRGDSGGPMTIMHENKRLLIGVSSGGPKKCTKNKPSFYSDLCVEKFSNWIRDTIAGSGECLNEFVPQPKCPRKKRS